MHLDYQRIIEAAFSPSELSVLTRYPEFAKARELVSTDKELDELCAMGDRLIRHNHPELMKLRRNPGRRGGDGPDLPAPPA